MALERSDSEITTRFFSRAVNCTLKIRFTPHPVYFRERFKLKKNLFWSIWCVAFELISWVSSLELLSNDHTWATFSSARIFKGRYMTKEFHGNLNLPLSCENSNFFSFRPIDKSIFINHTFLQIFLARNPQSIFSLWIELLEGGRNSCSEGQLATIP